MASRRHQRRPPVFTFLAAMSFAIPSVSFVPSAVTIVTCGATCTSRSRSPTCLFLKRTGTFSPSASAPRAAAAEKGYGMDGDDNDDIDQLVGIDKFRVEKAERDRNEAEVAAAAPAPAPAAAAKTVGKDVGLGLEGAIFPSDAFPGSPSTEDISLQGVKLESGQPKAMVGFWKVCWLVHELRERRRRPHFTS